MLSKGRSDIVTTGNDLTLRDGYSDETTIRTGANVAARVLTLPVTGADDTLVSNTSTSTLTNKTLTSPTITGGTISGAAVTGMTSVSILDNGSYNLILASSDGAFSANRTLSLDLNNAARTIDLAGNLTLAGNLSTSGAYALTLTLTGATDVTLPTTGTLATLAGTETFTNKTLTSPKLNEDVALTTTSTKLNYLTNATGTTGTNTTNVVFSTSPTLVTPTLGVASATSINKVAITAPATGSTLTIADGKTLTANNTMTLAGADDTGTLTLAAGTQVVGGNSNNNDIITRTATQTLTNKTLTNPHINTPVIVSGSADGLTALSIRDTSAAYDVTIAATSSTALTTGRSITFDVKNASRTVQLHGDLAIAGSFTTVGTSGLSLTTTGVTTVTLPLSGTLATIGNNETFTNKTLTSPTITAPTINEAYFTQAASATTPIAGATTIYVNSGDAKLHVVDSSGNDVAVGSGSSGRNYLGDWYDSAKAESVGTSAATSTGNRTVAGNTDPTKWVTSDLTNLTFARSADTTLRQSYNYLINSGDANADFVESPLFTLDGRDLGKPVSVSFDCAGVSASDDYQVCVVRYDSSGTYQEVIAIAGTASATTPYSARIPVGTTSFNGFFVAGATSTDQYAIRFMKHAVNVDLRIDSLYVGPQSVVQGAAVTDWVSFTPALTASGGGAVSIGTGGNAEATGFWRRQGDSMQIRVRWQWGTTSTAFGTSGYYQLTMPNGYSVDESKFHTKGCQIGYGNIFDSDLSDLYGIAVIYDPSSNDIYFNVEESTTSVTFGKTAPFTAASSDWLHAQLTVPIVGWSSNVTMANRSVEEFAASASGGSEAGWDAAASATDSVYGAKGAIMSGGLGAARTKVVRFQSPIQATDRLELEISYDGTYWVPMQGALTTSGGSPIFSGISAAGTAFGVQLQKTSGNSTDVDVIFQQYAAGETDDSSFKNWAANSRWRVRKVASGSSVGFPVSSANIVGRTDGVTVGSGYIGEKITGTILAPALTSTVTANAGSISLTPGVWLLVGRCYFNAAGTTTTTQAIAGFSTSSATIDTDKQVVSGTHGAGIDPCLLLTEYVNVSSTTTYYMGANATFAASTMAIHATSSVLYAIRMA